MLGVSVYDSLCTETTNFRSVRIHGHGHRSVSTGSVDRYRPTGESPTGWERPRIRFSRWYGCGYGLIDAADTTNRVTNSSAPERLDVTWAQYQKTRTACGNSLGLACESIFYKVNKLQQNCVALIYNTRMGLWYDRWKRIRFEIGRRRIRFGSLDGSDSSVVRAPDSWLKGRGFESLQERRENFLLQGRLSVLTLLSVSVSTPVLPQ